MHQTITVFIKRRVDPEGTLSIRLIGFIYFIVALLICRKIFRDIQSGSHIFSVQVVGLAITYDCINSWVILSKEWTQPWGSFCHSMASLISMILSINLCSGKSRLLNFHSAVGTLEIIVSPVKIIDIHTLKLIVPLVIVILTLRGIYMRSDIKFVPIPDAAC
jgi:hypothetical protein